MSAAKLIGALPKLIASSLEPIRCLVLKINNFQDEPSPGICDQLHEIVRSIGLLCYVACPPIPSEIIRKLAFHPPDKGATYRIELKSDPEKDLESVRDCHDEPVQLVVRDRVHPEVKVFSVTTSEDSHLVCVKCSPNCYSKNPEVANQVSHNLQR